MKKGTIIPVMLMMIVMAISSFAIAEFANVRVSFVSQSPSTVGPGDVVDLRWKFENRGASDSGEVEIEFVEDGIFTSYDGKRSRNIGFLDAWQTGDDSVIVHYKVKISENAVEGDNDIQIRYRFNEGPWIEGDEQTIEIVSDDAILYIKSVEVTPDRIGPKELSTVKMTLENLADSTLEDIVVTLDLVQLLTATTAVTVDEKPFSPVGSSTQKIVSKLESGEEAVIEYQLISGTDLGSEVYKVPYSIAYKDERRNTYTSSGYVTLIGGVAPELEVMLDDYDPVSMNAKTTLGVKFVNKGEGKLKFLDVSLKENGVYEILSNKDDYIGNIDSDDYESTDFEVFVKETDKEYVEFPLMVEYMDENFKVYSTEHILKLKIYSEEDMFRYGLKNRPNTTGNFIALGVLVVIVGFFVYRHQKKNKAKRRT